MNEKSLKNLVTINHIIQMLVFVLWNQLMIALAIIGLVMLGGFERNIAGAILLLAATIGFLGNRYLDERTPPSPPPEK